MEMSKSDNFNSNTNLTGLDYFKSLGVYNEDQLEQIRLGLRNPGVYVSLYSNPENSASTMKRIRLGIESTLTFQYLGIM